MSDTLQRPTHDPSPASLAKDEKFASISAIYRWLGDGTLTGYKVGRATRVHRESIEALRAKHATFAPNPYTKNNAA